VVVVVGSSADEVQAAIKEPNVRIVNNPQWMEGMSTSIKTGLGTLLGEVGGVVFLQADQPQIPSGLINSMVEVHQSSLNPIIAPQIDGQRGNPVLFDADTFPDLLDIEGDVGGRVLFSRYPVEWLIWHDPKLLLDIDSPEDYQIFLRTYPEGEVQA
jgi:molybdenum cofactor cytidylyltransferase